MPQGKAKQSARSKRSAARGGGRNQDRMKRHLIALGAPRSVIVLQPRDRTVPRAEAMIVETDFKYQMLQAAATNTCITFQSNAIGTACLIQAGPSIAAQSGLDTKRLEFDRYRVLSAEYEVEYWNADSIPVEIFAGHTNQVISKNLSTAVNYSTSPNWQRQLLPSSSVAFSRGKLRFRYVSFEDFFGGRLTYLADDNTMGPTGGSGSPTAPVNGMYFTVGSYSQTGGNMTNGVYLLVKMRQEVLFFERELFAS